MTWSTVTIWGSWALVLLSQIDSRADSAALDEHWCTVIGHSLPILSWVSTLDPRAQDTTYLTAIVLSRWTWLMVLHFQCLCIWIGNFSWFVYCAGLKWFSHCWYSYHRKPTNSNHLNVAVNIARIKHQIQIKEANDWIPVMRNSWLYCSHCLYLVSLI